MPIQTIYDVGDDYQITPFMDAGVYGSAIVDAVIKGIGDEFTMNWSPSSLDVTFDAGSEAVLCGSFFKITGSSPITVTLPSNDTFYLCARIDLTRNNGTRGYLACVSTSGASTTTNLNGNDTVHDLVLYQITTSASGITGVIDKRVIQNNTNSTVAGYAIVVLTQQEYDALQMHNSHTLYFIY